MRCQLLFVGHTVFEIATVGIEAAIDSVVVGPELGLLLIELIEQVERA